jgi:hypothetical protein
MFEPGKEVVSYRTPEECAEKIPTIWNTNYEREGNRSRMATADATGPYLLSANGRVGRYTERHLERFGHHAKDFFMRFRLRRLSGQIHDSQKSGNIGNLRPKSGQ